MEADGKQTNFQVCFSHSQFRDLNWIYYRKTHYSLKSLGNLKDSEFSHETSTKTATVFTFDLA